MTFDAFENEESQLARRNPSDDQRRFQGHYQADFRGSASY